MGRSNRSSILERVITADRSSSPVSASRLPYWAIFLLFAVAATAAEIAEPILQNVQRSDRGSELSVVPVIPETRGGPSPELPEIQPSAQPPSSLTVPAPPLEAAPLRQGPRFVLRDVNHNRQHR